jgi:dTDP-4-dehydrorhamnose reductase
MSTLLVSPDGMLGRAFERELVRRGEPFTARRFPDFDLTRPETLTLPAGTRRVILCAAYTDVDGAEADEVRATAVNGRGVGHVAAACREAGALLVHFGTDYVFAGDTHTPYPVDAPVAPRTAYGRSKAAGERALLASGAEHLYLRTSWLYAPWGKNFVRTIAALGRSKPELKVVDDQRGRPTSAEELVRTTFALLERDARGFLHATDGGECSWFEFAQAIVRDTGGSAQVVPCTSAEFPRPAPRPPYSVLALERTEALLGRPMRPWPEALESVLLRLEP